MSSDVYAWVLIFGTAIAASLGCIGLLYYCSVQLAHRTSKTVRCTDCIGDYLNDFDLTVYLMCLHCERTVMQCALEPCAYVLTER